MKLPFFIAKNYIKSKKDSRLVSLISVISITGIALGVAVLIIALTILDGFEETLTQKIINFNAHIKITAFQKRNLPEYGPVVNEIKNHLGPDYKSISPFAEKAVIARTRNNSDGIILTGYLPEMDNSGIQQYIIDGEYKLENSELAPITIGKKLADKLQLKLGEKLTVFSMRNDRLPTLTNPPGIAQFIVTGIYESGMAEFDDFKAYTHLHQVQEIAAIGNSVSGYNIQVNNLEMIDSLASKLADYLPFPYYARSMYRVHQNIFTWIDLQKKPIPIILGLITIVAVFNIIGTLLMIVIERTEHIGILKSLGAKQKQISTIFIYQGLYLSFIGITLGNLLAALLCFLQMEYSLIPLPENIYFLSKVPISFNLLNYLVVSLTAFIFSLLAAYIPSFVASKIDPIKSIRFK